MPFKNFTTDDEIRKIAKEENRIIISKDNDFYESCILKSEPEKLILVKTGNCRKDELLTIFRNKMEEILQAIAIENVVVITKMN